MFRFWGSESRCVEHMADDASQLPGDPIRNETVAQPSASLSLKRAYKPCEDEDKSLSDAAPSKRFKCSSEEDVSPCDFGYSAKERARDEIRHQFGVEILLKHNELRLINQELAKCQTALEQLRRCHLIPYPVNCPTPEQMMDISSGKGPALRASASDPVPRWAPPFGVVDGPYARHYAKWLIPDPSFDGQQPEWQFSNEASRARTLLSEGRTTRNSFTDVGTTKGRSVRGSVHQKLQSLPASYPQPKDKAGPCILKRADGQTVKLVCLDCHRENFSSTQGFINHCRIAHKRDFKSHEEAAVHSGQPIDAPCEAASNSPAEEKPQVLVPSQSACVHPFARSELSDTYSMLRSRITDSLKLYHMGKLPGVKTIPNGTQQDEATKKSRPEGAKSVGFVPAEETPYLSRLMQSRKFDGNLRDIVLDAKTKVSLDDITPGEEWDEGDGQFGSKEASPARAPIVMRIPAKTATSMSGEASARPASSKGRTHLPSPPSAPQSVATGSPSKHSSHQVLCDDDIDMEEANLSPNTMVSNNAPSLVSDDGEYDDSDDGSSVSGGSDNLDAQSVSDVAEITIDDDQDPRALRRESTGVSATMKLRKEESKQVTFMSPMKGASKERRVRRQ